MRIKFYNRYELKYLIDKDQYRAMLEDLAAYLEPDREGDERGRYSVTSLYYDTPDYQIYWDKIDGHRYRRKVRIRVYGDQLLTPESNCFVEIKQRLNQGLQKRRVTLPYAAALDLCGAGQDVVAASEADQAIVEEIQYLHYTLQLQPACIVSYTRLAFEGSEYDSGLRVTFDTNLKGRIHDLTLLTDGRVENRYFVPPEWCVMEVKVNYRVPYWLTELIARHSCALRRISKYCTVLEQSKALLQRQQIFY